MTWVGKILQRNGTRGELPYDPSRIGDYQPNRKPSPLDNHPHVAHFHKKNKHLHYVAAHHQTGTGSETARTIAEAIRRYQPQLIIVEGIETAWGISPTGYQDYVQSQAGENFEHSYERDYAAFLATQKGIPFIGGEPANAQVFDHMNAQGYSTKDVMGFYFLRGLPHMRDTGKITKENFDKVAADYFQNSKAFAHIPPAERMNVQEFHDWYHAHNDVRGRKPIDIQTHHLAPIKSQHATYFETMSRETGHVRELNLDGLIHESFKNNDRVMVVYGSGHLMQSRKVFEHMFSDKGTNERLV